MKHAATQAATDVAQNWLGLGLAGLGISLAPYEFVGGLVLAMAAGSLIAAHRKDSRKFWLVFLTSAFAAVISSLVSQQFDHWGWAPQLLMATAGGLSGWLMMFLVSFMDRIQVRAADVADMAITSIFKRGEK